MPESESARLRALRELGVLDAPANEAYDGIVRMAAKLCGTPMAAISLIDRSHQWLKASVGLEAREAPRESALCAHAIRRPHRLLVVHDAARDRRFRALAQVTGEPRIRFYAGAPLVTREGEALGTLFVCDRVPRELRAEQVAALRALARQAVMEMELRASRDAFAHHYREALVTPAPAGERMERRRKRDDLALAQRELSHILHGVPGMITRADRDGRLVFVNRAYAVMMGRPAEELIGRSLRELLLPEDLAQLQRHLDRVQAGHVTAFARTHHLPGGGVLQLEGRLVPEFDEDGRVCGWIAIFHDATEAQRSRALLAESEARFRQLTMLSSDWYWEQDEQFRFTFMSAGIEKHIGLKAKEHLGHKRWDVPALNLSEEDWARHRAQLERREPFRDFEMHRADKLGRLHWVSVSGDPVFDAQGQFRGYRGVGRDITDLRSAAERIEKINEELEERVEARTADLRAAIKELDAFTYSVSHDLRAPVGAIAGFTHLLRSSAGENLSADGRRLLGFVEQNATRMVGLIEGLLRFSRLGREDLRRTWLSMNEIAGESLLDFAEATAGAEVRVGDLPECHGDRALIGQVWANLVGNALKYSRGRQPARVEIGWDAAKRAYFVRDNGVGFDMAYAGKLFGVFERLHRESEFDGSGIGLAIAERIIKRHGGAIWAEAKVDGGATFWFTVPDARRAGTAGVAPAQSSEAGKDK